MKYRELAEMISVLLDEDQKDQEAVYHSSEYGLISLFDLKVSANERVYLSESDSGYDELKPGNYHIWLDRYANSNHYCFGRRDLPDCLLGKPTHHSVSINDAISCIQKSMVWNVFPTSISLNHDDDYYEDDDGLKFLSELKRIFPNGPVPECNVHSGNSEEIVSFLESWKKELAK